MDEFQNNSQQNNDLNNFSNVDNVQTTKNKRQKKGHSTIVVIIACLLAAIIGAGSSAAVFKLAFAMDDTDSNDQSDTKKVTSSSKDDDDKDNDDDDNKSNTSTIIVDQTASSVAQAVAMKCSDSVVGIRATSSVTSIFGEEEQSGDGSGVIYTDDGYIITNYHVIKEAVTSQKSRIDVYLNSNRTEPYSATVIGYNISCDLAVIKIDTEGLKPIELGNSDDLSVGQNVVTIGSPGGLEFMGSVTYGIISGLDRIISTDSEVSLIQTDAAINPGNSGGALLDANGKLVGINSSKIASVEYEAMGFAIPVNLVKEKCDKIISNQGEAHVYFGANISTTYTAEVLQYYGLPSGAVVVSVAEGSPAEISGIRRGDIITEFNGVAITDYTKLNDVLYECDPNATVSATIYRNGRYYTASIKLIPDTST